MLAWLIGFVVMFLAGAAASGYLWLIRRRRDELEAGLKALADMRWRDFVHLVLQAMGARGLHRTYAPDEDARESQGVFTLQNDAGKRWLLACKHGSAYRIGVAPVVELASSVRLDGAAGGILATEGHAEKEGRDAAQSNNIELLGGRRLWPLLKPLLDAEQRQEIVGNATARARRHVAIAWLAALAAGTLTAVGIGGLMPDPPAPAPATTPAGEAPARAAEPVVPYVEPTEDEMEQQRQAVVKALPQVPGLVRGIWLTKLTLAVDREIPESEAWPLICQQVELYPDLRTTRIQLNPPEGSNEPVRWRQCKTH